VQLGSRYFHGKGVNVHVDQRDDVHAVHLADPLQSLGCVQHILDLVIMIFRQRLIRSITPHCCVGSRPHTASLTLLSPGFPSIFKSENSQSFTEGHRLPYLQYSVEFLKGRSSDRSFFFCIRLNLRESLRTCSYVLTRTRTTHRFMGFVSRLKSLLLSSECLRALTSSLDALQSIAVERR